MNITVLGTSKNVNVQDISPTINASDRTIIEFTSSDLNENQQYDVELRVNNNAGWKIFHQTISKCDIMVAMVIRPDGYFFILLAR